eukprot:GHVU01043018.1.p4 GENE.GHVU01043018.1~~GHVU01043018.1.p4  ORF type:complete len:106 (+),score=9.22 GHVU01043018.1:1264-1581(+)
MRRSRISERVALLLYGTEGMLVSHLVIEFTRDNVGNKNGATVDSVDGPLPDTNRRRAPAVRGMSPASIRGPTKRTHVEPAAARPCRGVMRKTGVQPTLYVAETNQ